MAFGKAAAELGRLDHGAVSLVVREKERVIKQSEVLEYYPTEASLDDVGGLGQLKHWLDRRGRASAPGRATSAWTLRRVLLLGVQGCGKSLLAKAVAATWQFPLLRFDMGKVFGGIVGQSEGNIRTALQVAQALAPCVLWIDEIEKASPAWAARTRPTAAPRRGSSARC
ncbi:AAA family ATPase [Nannocystis pusilla]|uniref:AAA family ATPase n=1 Tax=Nannocystis pusilla TaxID=889268 RepID=UPI003B7AA8C6